MNRIPSLPESAPTGPLPSRRPFALFPLHPTHRGILLGQPAPRLGSPFFRCLSCRFSGRRMTTGSALRGGISMGLRKPEESLGQHRILLCFSERTSMSLISSD